MHALTTDGAGSHGAPPPSGPSRLPVLAGTSFKHGASRRDPRRGAAGSASSRSTPRITMGAGGPPHRALEAIRRDHPAARCMASACRSAAPAASTRRISRASAPWSRATSRRSSRASRLVDARDDLFQRPAAAALYRGDAGPRLRPHRRGARGDRPSDPAGKPLDLCPLPRIDAERDRLHPRRRAAHGMRLAARHQQCLRLRHAITASPRSTISPISRLQPSAKIHLAGHAEQADDEGERLLIDSHDGPVADAVWTLYRDHHRPLRADADADRMGQQHSRLADPARPRRARRPGACLDRLSRRSPPGAEPCSLNRSAAALPMPTASAMPAPSRPALTDPAQADAILVAGPGRQGRRSGATMSIATTSPSA